MPDGSRAADTNAVATGGLVFVVAAFAGITILSFWRSTGEHVARLIVKSGKLVRVGDDPRRARAVLLQQKRARHAHTYATRTHALITHLDDPHAALVERTRARSVGI